MRGLGSFGLVGFTLGRPGDRWVHSGRSCGTSGSFGFFGFITSLSGGRLVHLGS